MCACGVKQDVQMQAQGQKITYIQLKQRQTLNWYSLNTVQYGVGTIYDIHVSDRLLNLFSTADVFNTKMISFSIQMEYAQVCYI